MTDTRDRARAVLDRHPDASPPELLGALALDPRDESNRRLVEDLTGEPLGDADDPAGDDADGTEQRTVVTDGGTDLDASVDPDATVAAELHYTTFADAETFAALVQRHGLDYAGTTDHLPGPGATPFVWGSNPGTDEQVLLAAGCHPVTGEFHAGGYREEGYASYLYLAGPAYAAEPLYRDVHETAERIKGEFSPLATVEDTSETPTGDHRLATDGGTRSMDAGGDPDPDPPLDVGVYDEDREGVERAAEQRGRYLARTTALDERPAKAVALSEMGFSDSGIAKRLDATEGTVTGYLDAVADRYGIGATFPKTPEQRGELNATGGER